MPTANTKVASSRGEVLVVIMNRQDDWQIVNEQRWYRIPVKSAPKRWPPSWIAFYQTKTFREEAYAVRYFAKVTEIKIVTRFDLFPDEFIESPLELDKQPGNGKPKRPTRAKDTEYFQLFLEPVTELHAPIPSLRFRRIVFIPTTLHKLKTADEINDLFDDSPLEDALWQELKKLGLNAERQFFIKDEGRMYAMDFAIFCKNGQIDVETDGDQHKEPDRSRQDKLRNNALASQGWLVLRFDGNHVRESMAEYCVPKIVKTVKKLGGVKGK